MSFGMIPLNPDQKPDGFVLLSMYENLGSENAKLREQSERLFDKTLELATDNAKLRELVRAAWKCIHSGLSCSDCRLVAGGCTLESAMRELGVEVSK